MKVEMEKAGFLKIIFAFLAIVGIIIAVGLGIFFMFYKNYEEEIEFAEEKMYGPEIMAEQIDFFGKNFVQEYKINGAEFKIYPLDGEKFIWGYFEAYNNGQKVYSSEPVYAIFKLLKFECLGSKYIILSEYSGGAHCCFREYIFWLSEEKALKLIKVLPLGNVSIEKESLVLKDGKLYLKIKDDRFAYFYTSYVGTYFFDNYFLLSKNKLSERNFDFKEEHTKEAERCEKELADLSGDKTEYLEEWFPFLICRTTNYLLAGREDKAWQGFEEYFDKFRSQLDPLAVKEGIIEKMK